MNELILETLTQRLGRLAREGGRKAGGYGASVRGHRRRARSDWRVRW